MDMRVPWWSGLRSVPGSLSTDRRAMTLEVSGLGSLPVSTMHTAARCAGAGIQVESVALAAAAWLVKTSSANAEEVGTRLRATAPSPASQRARR